MKVHFIHKTLGVSMWVTESEVESFKAAGHILAADSKSEKPIMPEPVVDVEKKPVKKTLRKR
jgi:hypothetical protein